MSLWTYLQILRKRWLTVALFVLLGSGAAFGVTAAMTPVYSAQASSFITITSSGSVTNSLYENGQFAMARVKSYALLTDSPKVLKPVIKQLGLQMTPTDLAKQVTATNPTETALINIVAESTDPERAAAIANTTATELGKEIEKLETPRSGDTPPVKATLSDPAAVPTSPSSPRVPLNLALGFLVGLALGVAAAVVRELLDTTVKTADDLQAVSGQTPLALLDAHTQLRDRPLVALEHGSGAVEEFRKLRTNLKYVDVDCPPHVFVVTSAAEGEGKTTTACNLAITMAQSGVTTCLVEADLRRPMASEYLGVEGAVGLTDVVAGQFSLSDVLVPWNRALMNILPAGTVPSDPSQLLGSKNMEMLLTDLRARFDVVVIDTPPLLPVTDAAVLAQATDGALLVARYGSTRRDRFAEALESLSTVNATLVGTVMTFVPKKQRQRGNYYGYTKQPEPMTLTDYPDRPHAELTERTS